MRVVHIRVYICLRVYCARMRLYVCLCVYAYGPVGMMGRRLPWTVTWG